ncbi:MAG: FAD-dependent oxidoreductase [Gammaproteobacteria bacterium]|nr:FAD-dependent oxidoreductase [Gammaproteobacteria bacterium]
MKIAIIGAGISGLTAAHHLNSNHDITVLEKNNYVGGHSNTIDVNEGNKSVAIDTGFIVLNNWTYPNFENLLDTLDVELHNSEMSFSAKCEHSKFEWCGKGIQGLALNRNNWYRIKSYQILFDFLRFNKLAKKYVSQNNLQHTLGEFLALNNFSKSFKNYYILPMGAAIWSSSTEDIYDYPAQSFLTFFNNHGLLNIKDRPQWKTIVGGSRQYVNKLIQPFHKKISLNSKITYIKRDNGSIIIHYLHKNPEIFDHVIFACHSDEALELLEEPTLNEQHTLEKIRYQYNEAVLHTDESLMPTNRKAWSSWNYLLPEQATTNSKVTYYMNRLQPLQTEKNYFVTLNLTDRIDPDKIIKKIAYQHPVFDENAIQAQKNLSLLNGNQNTWFCGAYWRNGFHEDGVWSALTTIEQFTNEACKADDKQLHLQRAS